MNMNPKPYQRILWGLNWQPDSKLTCYPTALLSPSLVLATELLGFQKQK